MTRHLRSLNTAFACSELPSFRPANFTKAVVKLPGLLQGLLTTALARPCHCASNPQPGGKGPIARLCKSRGGTAKTGGTERLSVVYCVLSNSAGCDERRIDYRKAEPPKNKHGGAGGSTGNIEPIILRRPAA